MGRKKLETSQKIEDPYQRSVTFCKRKRGAIKKLIELSNMCGTQIHLTIFDCEMKRLVTY